MNKIQVKGEFCFPSLRLFCLRRPVLCLRVFLCDGMQNKKELSQVGEGCQGRVSVFRAHTQQKRLPSSGTMRSPVAVHGC